MMNDSLSILKNHDMRYTLGGAFLRSLWIVGIVAVLTLIGCIGGGWLYGGAGVITSAVVGWVIAWLFSELTPLSNICLDYIGLKGQYFMSWFMFLWGAKIVFVVLVGFILFKLFVLDLSVVGVCIVTTTAVCLVMNLLITAFARVL